MLLVTRSFDVFFDLRPNKRVNNGEAGDLRRHRAHCDVIVMGTVYTFDKRVMCFEQLIMVMMVMRNRMLQ